MYADRAHIIDVRKGMKTPAQVWTGIPEYSDVTIEACSYGGAHRVTLVGRDANRNGLAQVWDLRKNAKLFTVAGDHAGGVGATHKNVFATAGSRCVSIWDLTKGSSGTLGDPVRTVRVLLRPASMLTPRTSGLFGRRLFCLGDPSSGRHAHR